MSGVDLIPVDPNAISALNEYCMNRRQLPPEYALEKKEGMDNCPTLTYSCTTSAGTTRGVGHTKKEARTSAADQMMKLMRGLRMPGPGVPVPSPITATVTPVASVTPCRPSLATGGEEKAPASLLPHPGSHMNPMTELNEFCQARKDPLAAYSQVRAEGQSHAMTFTFSCTTVFGTTEGTASSVKEAKKVAAAKMLTEKIPGYIPKFNRTEPIGGGDTQSSFPPERQVLSPMSRMVLTSPTPAAGPATAHPIPMTSERMVQQMPVTVRVVPLVPAAISTAGYSNKRDEAEEDRLVFQFMRDAQDDRHDDLYKKVLDIMDYEDNEDGEWDAESELRKFCESVGTQHVMRSRAVGTEHQSSLRLVKQTVVVAMSCGSSSRSQRKAESNAIKRLLLSFALPLH